ncbi:hypothetical protein MP228_011399 [Amoeboaphelidium protococcarum]|nr:hypothetical protein MP228_011399 [Amoeboaphelidium protococcarum]
MLRRKSRLLDIWHEWKSFEPLDKSNGPQHVVPYQRHLNCEASYQVYVSGSAVGFKKEGADDAVVLPIERNPKPT